MPKRQRQIHEFHASLIRLTEKIGSRLKDALRYLSEEKGTPEELREFTFEQIRQIVEEEEERARELEKNLEGRE